MAQENNQVSVEEVGSAALKGAGSAVNHKIIEPLSKLTEPDDMNPEHMPHPLDDAAVKLSNLPSRLAGLTEPKDMNISNSPHPVDATLAAAEESINQVKAAGAIKGTELAAEMAVGAVIDGVNPGKKLEVADKVLDAAGQIRHVEGRLVDEITTGQGLAVPNDIGLSKTGLAKIKEQATGLKNKALDVAEKIPVVGDLVAPTLDQRILHQAHNERPRVMEVLDEKHRIGGDAHAMLAQHSDKFKRAEILAEQVRINPEAAAAINRRVTNADIHHLLNNSTNEQLGLPHNPVSVPKLPSPEQQAMIDARTVKLQAGQQALAEELAYQETLNPVQKAFRKIKLDTVDAENGSVLYSRYGMSQADKLKMEASEKDSQVLGMLAKNGARAAAQVGALATAGVYIATRDRVGDEEKKQDLSKTFQEAIVKNSDKAMQQLSHDNPELKGAALYYQSAKNGLKGSDGRLNADEAAALAKVGENVVEKIKTEGPQYFDKTPQSLMREEAAPAVTMQYDLER